MTRHAGLRVDDATWAAIRLAYEDSAEPVTHLAVRFDVNAKTIRTHAQKHGWRERPTGRTTVRRQALPPPLPLPGGDIVSTAGLAAGDATAVEASGSSGVARVEPDPAHLRIQRIYRILDMQIDLMERLMSSGEALSPQDQERQTRAMSGLLGNLETTTEQAKTMLGAETHPDAEAGHGRAEAERLRREIAERLERLSAQWHAQTTPE